MGPDQVNVLLLLLGQSALVGISLMVKQHQIEYWMPIQLQPIADEPHEEYLVALKNLRGESLSEMAPMIAQFFVGREIEHIFRMRYQSNMVCV
jgi:hypothetical protein